MSIFANLVMLLLGIIVVILPTAVVILVVYKLIKRLSHDHIEYQYRYQQYKEAETEFNDIEADIKQHLEEDR